MENQTLKNVNQSAQPQSPPKQLTDLSIEKKFNWWMVLTIVFLLLFIGSVGLYFLRFNTQIMDKRESAFLPSPTSSIEPVSTPSLTLSPEPKTIIPSDWKTFYSKEFDYEIKYPPEMTLGGRPPGAPDYYDDVSFYIVVDEGVNGHWVDGFYVNILTEENDQELNLKDWVKNRYSEGYPSVASIEDFLVGGLNAVRVLGQGMDPFDEIIIPQGKKMFIILGSYVGSNKQSYNEIYNIMLSSFKFSNN